MRIVQFTNGKYGVRLGFWPFYKFYGSGYTWTARKHIFKYCMFDTVEEAEQAFNEYHAKVMRVVK